MSDDIEVPKRGYDTKDVEAMTKEINSPPRARGLRVLITMLVIAGVALAVWFFALRQ